ncbi:MULTISPECIES: galactosyltransferase-related protein [unclassified Proteiniphilum]|jgi:predicted glycosyltransferase involved in capsule biosynthesis|uniref:galactosyltransferase-related protein n=1 Tax=unclassified Proteiniphilum TaxID=2622718 RepID=UPI00257D290E|nr:MULTISPECIES: galactosyltransferase-related protein [unclassified Proteiniphilum]
MDVTQELTVVIPVRIDCIERKENLNTVLFSLLKTTAATIIVLEADNERKYFYPETTEQIKHHFIEDHNPISHRTLYLNQLLKMTKTNIVGIWDTDVIFENEQIEKAVREIQSGITLCYPYDGRFVFLNAEKSEKVREDVLAFLADKEKETNSSLFARPSVGGALIVNKQHYVAAGGENENFYGWGPEDAERFKRMEILEEPVSRISGALYHLHHPRGINSTFGHDERDKRNVQELIKICRMNSIQLKKYINMWDWKMKNDQG